MGGISRRFWVVAALLVLVNVIGLLLIRQEILSRPLPGLRLISHSPTQGADEADRIVLRFDEPVMRADQCNARLDESPYVIHPAPPAGHWRWERPDQLVYLLESKLPAGREFVVKPADDIETQLGRRVVGEAQFTVRTSPLALLDAQVTAGDDEHATVELRFNQPVRNEEIVRHVQVKVAGARSAKPMAVQCLTPGVAERMTIRFSRPARAERMQVIVAGELTGDGGSLAMGRETVREIVIQPKFRLRNAEIDGDESVRISLWFTQRLATDKPLPAGAVSVTPKVADLAAFHARNGDHLSLTGSFVSGTRYQVTVSPNLLSHKGEPLGSPQSLNIEVPDRDPLLRLPVSRGILSPHGNLALDLKTCNIEGFTLSAAKLHANNLVPHLRGEEEEATSRPVVERPIQLKGKPNQTTDVAIDLRQLLDKNAAAPGVYHINVRAKKPYWLSDDSTVTISDLAITAKQQTGGHQVLVTSLATAKPVEGVTVHAITYSNQTLATAQTDEQGVAVLKTSATHPDGPVWLITAQLGDDLNFIQPERRRWVLDEVDQKGRTHPSTYDVMLYTERGVYRPGDVVHLTAIVREPDGAVPPPMPLVLRVKRPDGRVVSERTLEPDAGGQGVMHVDYASLSDGQLGRYEFQISIPGSSKALATATALIEAFVPVRIEVQAKTTQLRHDARTQPQIEITGRYLFGQPAADLPYVVSATLHAQVHESARFKDFTFDRGEPARRIRLESIDGSLDAQGRSVTTIPVSSQDHHGLWRAQITATVTEPGGRSVSQNTQAIVDLLGRHAGLRMEKDRVVRTGTPVSIDACLVTGDDEPAASERMKLVLERLEYDWVLEQVNGQPVWKSSQRIVPVMSRTFMLDEQGVHQGLEFTCEQPGNHRVRIIDEISGIESHRRFHASDHADESTSPPVTTPERVELVLDRKDYRPGETATVTVRSPFAGTLMLTMETDRIVERHVLPMEQNTAVIRVPVSDSLRGGAFLCATVIRPLQSTQSKWLPHRAMGMARLDVDHSSRALPVQITAPQKVEPGESVQVLVKVPVLDTDESPQDGEPPSTARPVVHLWAVDDGILLTSQFRTPDPMSHFFAPRMLEVTTSDVFADLLPDHARPLGITRIGAGDDGEESLRRSPVAIRQRDAAVVWRTAEPVGEDGTLKVMMTMPRITGRMRLMAVAVAGDRYGSAQHEVTLASPLMAEAGWPRFAAPGDRFETPVKLFNNTQAPLKVKLTVDIDGPATVEEDVARDLVTVAPGQPVTVWLKMQATAMGQVQATVSATGFGSEEKLLTYTQTTPFTVRPATPLHVQTQMVRLKAGEATVLPVDDAFVPGTARSIVSISGRPQVELRPAVEQLLDYPYGCVEQTTSRLMAILHAPQLLALESSDDARIEFANDAIAAGIARLWSMQTKSGGLSYWPGDLRASTWGSAYASLFLVEARRAGHRVDGAFTGELVKYLSARLDADEDEQPADANLKAMICHVLAALDHAPHGWIARLTERSDDLNLAGRAHLAAAWREVGRNDKALSLLSAQVLAMPVSRGGASDVLSSQTRQEAMALNVLLDLDREHVSIVPLVKRVESLRKQGGWPGTLDNATALAALSKYQLAMRTTPEFKGEMRIGENDVRAFDHRKEMHWKLPATDQPMSVTSEGRGDLYITRTTQGLLKADRIQPYQRGLRVERRWRNRQGGEIDPASLKVGDLIHVEIELSAPQMRDGESIGHIAVVDALPGGVEVENPRLATSAADDDDSSARADRVEFMDDRVVIFASATHQPQVFRYLLRVTTTGTYASPPVQASSMYDDSVAAMGTTGVVKVTR